MGETAIGLYQQHQLILCDQQHMVHMWRHCGIGESHIITSSVHAIAVGSSFSTVATTLGPATAMGELAIGRSITMITSRRHDDLCVICVPRMNEEVAL